MGSRRQCLFILSYTYFAKKNYLLFEQGFLQTSLERNSSKSSYIFYHMGNLKIKLLDCMFFIFLTHMLHFVQIGCYLLFNQ